MSNIGTISTRRDSDRRDRDTAHAVTRLLLGLGVIAGPFYVAVSLAQALTRDGFDITRHAWSLLANGDLGWLQMANLILTGAIRQPMPGTCPGTGWCTWPLARSVSCAWSSPAC
jgi:hypothetical protein